MQRVDIVERFLSGYSKAKPKSIFTGTQLPSDVLQKHRSKYLTLDSDETVLVLLNKGAMFGAPFTGLALTSKRLHFLTLKKHFFASIIPLRGACASMSLDDIHTIRIGEHDSCFGTAYVGHELVVNGECLGFVRMGTGITYDEPTLDFLNELFANLDRTK